MAEVGGLTLLRSKSSPSGFQGVSIDGRSKVKRYKAQVRRGGEQVSLGLFATAEEAALAFARSPEGRAAAAAAAAAPAPLTAAEARRQAKAEGLTLLRSERSATGFQGVSINSSSKTKPYAARVRRGGTKLSLGLFATAEEAALACARTPEGRAAAAAAAAAPAPLTAAEARRQAEAEGLALLHSESNAAGFVGVAIINKNKSKSYRAQVMRGGKNVYLGNFATAEEAALAYARTPEARAAAAAAVRRLWPAPKAKSQPPAMPADAVVKEEEEIPRPAWPDGALIKTEVKQEPSRKQEPPAMPDGAVVKEDAWPVEGTADMQAAAVGSAVARKRRRLGSA